MYIIKTNIINSMGFISTPSNKDLELSIPHVTAASGK